MADEADKDVLVTPEMIEAGIAALREHQLDEPWAAVLSDVYMAMALERLHVLGKLDRLHDHLLEVGEDQGSRDES